MTYDYVAMSAQGGQMALGAYTGDGTDNRSITDIGFQPDLVWLMSDTTSAAVYRSSSWAGVFPEYGNVPVSSSW